MAHMVFVAAALASLALAYSQRQQTTTGLHGAR